MRKKKFIVLPRNERIFEKGLFTGKGHRKFKKAGAMWITDEAEAREIDHEYGMKGSKQVAVTTDQQYEWSANNEGGNGTKMDNIHHYTFSGVDMTGIRATKQSNYVWVRRGVRQVMVRREEAEQNGEIPVETRTAAQGAEVNSGLHGKSTSSRRI